MKFSERIGKKPIKTTLQIESMDSDLRNGLWNAFQLYFLEKVRSDFISLSNFNHFFMRLWHFFLKLPLDHLDDDFTTTYGRIRKWFFEWEWYEVYDFIEFVYQTDSPADKEAYKNFCNGVLESELSGYRFIGEHIVPITDENELKEIEQSIEISKKTIFSGVNEHLNSALTKLSDRKNPDYRNSIKESISAVEAISKIISGKSRAELGEALNIIQASIDLHPALKKGFTSIYGYTSDEGGIRHAMLEKASCDFEDAKYMLVSCSAFVNYLIMKATKAGFKF
jgi:hypothetical protein